MAQYTVATTDEEEKVLSYASDDYNVSKVPTLTKAEYVQLIFNERVVAIGALSFFEKRVVADAYEAANKTTQDQVDAILGVVK